MTIKVKKTQKAAQKASAAKKPPPKRAKPAPKAKAKAKRTRKTVPAPAGNVATAAPPSMASQARRHASQIQAFAVGVIEREIARQRAMTADLEKQYFAALEQHEGLLDKQHELKKAREVVAEDIRRRARAELDAEGVPPRPAPIPTGLEWFDAASDGGITPGGVYVIEGGPGVGKSTAAMQVLMAYASKERRCLYISSDETERGLGQRWLRLPGNAKKKDYVDVCTSVRSGEVAGAIRQVRPALVVIDQIGLIVDPLVKGSAGSLSQVKNLVDLCLQEAGAATAAGSAVISAAGSAVIFVMSSRSRSEAAVWLGARVDLLFRLMRSVPDDGEGTHILAAEKNRYGRPRAHRMVMTKAGYFKV
jgi:hypothetical protein